MSLSIYKQKNGSWRADLDAYGQRKSKVHATKADAKRWSEIQEREFFLNYSTQQALNKKYVITVGEALARYSNEVSRFKKTAKKEMQRILYYQGVLPHVDWPLYEYKSEFLKQWEDSVMKRSIRPLKASSVLRDYSTLSAFLTGVVKIKDGLILILSKISGNQRSRLTESVELKLRSCRQYSRL